MARTEQERSGCVTGLWSLFRPKKAHKGDNKVHPEAIWKLKTVVHDLKLSSVSSLFPYNVKWLYKHMEQLKCDACRVPDCTTAITKSIEYGPAMEAVGEAAEDQKFKAYQHASLQRLSLFCISQRK
ncbi:hypothetical protein SELMODRAFT_421662 [Selaginella moellendorffii]|uniref:Uncharacterized protein n=1 Tax=Selaginella moellendorffii TaxID=88036 RepID=D8SFZ0_SELML|nr:hypothetical protein SELMODRAFT_421662 [Selaginella moellendorffii]